MSDERVKPRRYDNSGRAEQARQVRRRILQAAHELLLDRGYAGTTIADVAARATVSAETVYKRFGGKAGLAKAVYDVRLAGDDEPVPIAERPAMRALVTTSDPARVVKLYAAVARELAERSGPLTAVLFEARGADADLASFARTVEAERLVGATRFVERLAALDGLRAGLPVEQARDIVWTVISPEVYILLVIRRGWPGEQYQAWLTQTLLAALL